MTRSTLYRAAAFAVVVVGATACGTATTTSTGTSDAGASIVGSSIVAKGSAADHNSADVTFTQGMIVHHRAAVAMTEMVAGRAEEPRVIELAARIAAAQQPEIEQMTSWLERWGVQPAESGDLTGMDHGGMTGMDHGDQDADSAPMPGMMSDDDMADLTSASGAGFDKLFLQLMIRHHQGALEMADTELAQGGNADALALAATINAGQGAEIAEMQQLLSQS